MLTIDELSALILPWAKEKHPDKYAATLKVAVKQATFRRYVARLIEVRYEEEPEWRERAPLRALEETSLRVRMRHPATGTEIEVCGRGVEGRTWGFAEMAEALEAGLDFETVKRIKDGFDLECMP